MKSNSIVPVVPRRNAAKGSRGGHALARGLLEPLHRRARRNRNLAELRALDACRLADIGLSEEARGRIVG